MLIIYAFACVYVLTFFTLMALVGIGYLAAVIVRRIRSRRMLMTEGPEPMGVRRFYSEDSLKAA